MSRLDELIAELCPDGVEYKALEDVCSFQKGEPITVASLSPGRYPVVAGGKRPAFYCSKYNRTGEIITISSSGAYAGYINYWNEPILCTDSFSVNPKIDFNIKMLFYIMQSKQNNIFCMKKGGGVPHVYSKDIGKIKIPVPPLLVQEEIVRILEPFRKLSEELTLELTKREYQYKYYRDIFLVYNLKNVKKILLGDIGRVSMCKRILKSETSLEGDVPFYKIGTFGKYPDAYISRKKYEEYKNKYPYPKKGDVLISAAGTIGRAVIYNGEDAYYQDSNIVWIDNNESKVLNKFLYYFYQLKPWYVSTGGTIARLYNDNINRTPIPVPPLEEQERIVAILDRFNALCNGLPAEIEARKKQYEYYRDKLLTFKEAV